MTHTFNDCFKIINIKQSILEIRNISDFLYTRSKSKYITVYEYKNPTEKRVIDNQEEVIAIYPYEKFLITCDVKYDIR